METVIAVLVVVAVVDAILRNRSIAIAAMAGVEFHVPAPPAAVARAVHAAHNVGVAAQLKAFVVGIRVTGNGSSFRFESRIGDTGRIEVIPEGDGTLVRAATEVLYLGAHPRTFSPRAGLWGFPPRPGHLVYTVLGIAPNATKMLRFQRTLERRITSRLTPERT